MKKRDTPERKQDLPRGVLSSARALRPSERIAHERYLVDAPLSQSLEHWWTVSWQLELPFVQETLPHPCVHVVFEHNEARVVGVVRGRFTRVLEGTGRVFGAKFWPGAFRPLLSGPVSSLTDRVVPLAQIVGEARAKHYEQALRKTESDAERVHAATEFFHSLLPAAPSDTQALRALLEAAANDRTLTSVEALRERSGLSLRELQRWFRDAVGISPKWVLQRYRLHEAVLSLSARPQSLTALAQELGYADQAHFARDFSALVGVPPSRYGKLTRP